ncbi:MAG: O-antigen ligase family protein, partial [Solirubrobacteraceae bacterium]
AANQRAAVREGLRSPLAAHQGNELIAIAIAVALAVALLVGAIVLVERHVERPRLLLISRQKLTRLTMASLLVAVVAFVAAGGVGFLHQKWDQFKSPNQIASSSGTAFARLGSAAGEGRYQYWQVAARAASRKPLTGTGANTFQFQWLQHGVAAGGFVVDAHSLYLQALSDLGYPGLVLIAGFILWILGCGVWRVIRSRDPAQRLALAAATAGAFAFAVSAAIDWIWFIPVLPVALFVCAGVIFAPEQPGGATGARPLSRRWSLGALVRKRGVRAALQASGAVACLAIIVAIAVPMAATEAVRESQSLVQAGNLPGALERADEAVALQPYAATGWLQEALVEEQAGNLRAALKDAEQAKDRQPVNWSNWLVLSRLEARTGHASAALADYDHARLLDPHNPLFS